MGTCGDDNDKTRYFSQRDRLFQEALDAEYTAETKRRNLRVAMLVTAMVLIPAALFVWMLMSVQ